jgi:choice-of-anchor B domain-containing protein
MKLPAFLLTLLIVAVSAVPASTQEPNFGRAVALDAEDLLVGQPVNWYGPGTVYAYRLGPDGAWVERALLTAPDSARMDDFGRALALDGNRFVTGAPRKRDGVGVVYTFERTSPDADWSFASQVEAPGGIDAREFGTALALMGDELLVGSPAAEGTGAVYRYTRTDGGWTAAGVISPPEGAVAGFGWALSRAGHRLLVGAPGTDSIPGSAWVVERDAEGWGVPTALASPEEPGGRARFGSAVLLAGERAWVGAPGAAMVAAFDAADSGTWRLSTTLTPFAGGSGSGFGFSLATAGAELWVGAPGASGSDGRVYRYTADGAGGWQSAERVDPDETEGSLWPLGFGHALAASESQVVVGMPTRDFGEGRALAFARSGGDWEQGALLEGRIFRLGEELASGDRCLEGSMSEFPCANMELVAHLPISELGGERGVWVNDVWGWTDPETARRYALVARRDGASFVDVTEAASPRVVGNLPRTPGSRPSVWRDIKVVGTHAFIVADGAGAHGMQVFDLTRLRSVGDAPAEFEPDLTYDRIFSAHNVVADTASGFVYVVGANSGGETCGGGLHMVDVRNPEAPTFAGCYNDTEGAGGRGYTHDAQCVVYHGPDEAHRGRQICLGSNATELNIADVTDKANPFTIARATYPNVAYAHQGWLDEEHRYFYMNDEADETSGLVDRTRTLVWDLTDLDDPFLVTEYFGPVAASDHNLYVVGDRMYQSNYGSGLRVLDISDRANPREIGFFDSAPYNDDEPGFSATESGAWSNYPFFGEGLVIFTSVREGLFIMRVDLPVS